MDEVQRIINEASERARREIEENDRRRASKEEDYEVLDSDIVSREVPDFVEAREIQIDNSSKEIDRDYTMTREEAAQDKSDELTKELEKSIERYMDDTPSFASRMAKKFMNLVQKEENLEIKKRRPLYKTFTPYAVLATMALSSLFITKMNKIEFKQENVSFSNEVENIFDSVDKAPVEVMDAYVSETTSQYFRESVENKDLRNEDFESAYRKFYSELAKENPDLAILKEAAKEVSNIAANDRIKATVPFEYSNFKGSILQEGEAFIPVTDESQIKDGEWLTVHNGHLYRRGR